MTIPTSHCRTAGRRRASLVMKTSAAAICEQIQTNKMATIDSEGLIQNYVLCINKHPHTNTVIVDVGKENTIVWDDHFRSWRIPTVYVLLFSHRDCSRHEGIQPFPVRNEVLPIQNHPNGLYGINFLERFCEPPLQMHSSMGMGGTSIRVYSKSNCVWCIIYV